MRPDEYCRFDALGLAELVRTRTISATEIHAAARTAMLALDRELGFLVGELAEEADRNLRSLPADGPFIGVPTLVKDIGPKIGGAPQEMGCRLAAGLVSPHDSELVKRYRKAGVVFIGRSSTPELGSAFTTEPKFGRATRNPWRPSHSTGGSSGGAAALVAAGVAPFALAGDTAGSIRVPAHCCGVFGFKPTRAATPCGPDNAEGSSGLTVAHVISRSVRDSAAALDATFGGDAGCRYVAPPPRQPFLQAAGHDPARLRVALTVTSPFGTPVAADVVEAATQAAELCEELGHIVEVVSPPLDGEEMFRALLTIVAANAASGTAALKTLTGRDPAPPNLEASNHALYEHGARLSAGDLLQALATVNRISRRMGAFMERHDVILSPSFSRTAPRLGEIKTDESGVTGERYIRESLAWSPFTSQFNLTGQPAMSVPFSLSADGLPIGVQFAAAFGDDESLFSLAGQFERARPWIDRSPPVHASCLQGGGVR